MLDKLLFRLPLDFSIPKAEKGDNFLLVRDDGIGDLVVPGLATVKWLLDNKQTVYLVLKEEFFEIGKLILPEKYLIPLNYKKYRNDFKYRKNFLSSLRKIGFSTALGSAIHSTVNTSIVRYCGAVKRWAYKRNNSLEENIKLAGLKKIIGVSEKSGNIYDSVLVHEVKMLSAIFGRDEKDIKLNPFLDTGIMTKNNEYGNYVLYHVDAGSARRVYPKEKLLPILSRLCEKHGLTLILTGLTRLNYTHGNCIDLTGKTSLSEVINLIANAGYVVGNESGLVHLAWVMRKHTAMFLGGGHFGRFRPVNATLFIKEPECRCDNWRCKYDAELFPCVNFDSSIVYTGLNNFLTDPESCVYKWDK